MKSYSTLVHETNTILHIRGMVEVYEELAAMHLSAIRKEIVQNRAFFERLAELSIAVGSDTEPDESVQNKQISLLVTANEGLYGDIIERTFQHFLHFITTNQTDIVVIGKIGTHLMHTYAKHRLFTTFTLSDTHIDEHTFANIVDSLSPYRTIHVFYGKFASIATQQVTMSTLIGDVVSPEAPTVIHKKQRFYVYEPTIQDVSTLFGTEIKASVLNQMLQESQLAKHASRMMHLDSAIEHMDENLQKLTYEKRQSLKKIAERKQQARIAGLMARGGI